MKVAMDAFLSRFVKDMLLEKWSPNQMSGYLKRQGISVSEKAIYKFIGKRGMNHLLFWGRNQHKRGKKVYRYQQVPDDRKYIEKRPVLEGVGHYEMDFIVSRKSTWVLLVIVDRMSKQAFVEKLANRKHTTINRALSRIFTGKPLRSITTDNDIAFSGWKQLEILLGTQIYFCHPYHSWEKGLVENTNRWIREFVSKKRDIGTVTDQELVAIDRYLNWRPREVIGFQFPGELYYQHGVLLEG
jgi:IS30 family transposase